MSYSVIVIMEAGHARIDNPISRLQVEIGRHETGVVPGMGPQYIRVYSVYDRTHRTSMRRFRKRYSPGEEARAFYFLNDVAIRACHDFGIEVTPRGTISESELPLDRDTVLDRTYSAAQEANAVTSEACDNHCLDRSDN